MSERLTKPMRLCLTYYGENETNPNRVIKIGGWTIRQTDIALDNDWLKVGPGGWHILTDAGRAALASQEKPNDQ